MSKEARGTRFLWIWRSGKTRVLADPAEDHGLVSSNHKAAEPQFNPTDSGTLFWPPKVPHTHMVSIQTCRQTHKSLLKRNLSPRLLPASLFLSSSLALSPPLAERSSYRYNKTLLNHTRSFPVLKVTQALSSARSQRLGLTKIRLGHCHGPLRHRCGSDSRVEAHMIQGLIHRLPRVLPCGDFFYVTKGRKRTNDLLNHRYHQHHQQQHTRDTGSSPWVSLQVAYKLLLVLPKDYLALGAVRSG